MDYTTLIAQVDSSPIWLGQLAIAAVLFVVPVAVFGVRWLFSIVDEDEADPKRSKHADTDDDENERHERHERF